jgi:MFS family permease
MGDAAQGGSGPFPRFWTSATLSAFGTTATAVALPVLVVEGLRADPVQVGIVNAAQFIPYAVLGLVAGVFVDRWRRRPVLVVASLGRAVSLAAIALLALLGLLTVPILVGLLLLFGGFAVFGAAASQSILPSLVLRDRLLRSNARLDQGETAAQTAGPTLGGLLVRLLGAPIALAVDAVTYVVEALLVATLRVEETPSRERRRVLPAIAEGLRASYRHPVLAPMAISTHVWFVANAASLTVLSLLALRTLELGALLFGVLLSVVGAAAFVGASVAERVGRRLGEGATITAARVVYPLAWGTVALAVPSGGAVGVTLLFVALAFAGFAAGVENPSEMSYRQSVAPDAVLGRMNATIRSVNRTCAVVGAIAGGALVGAAGVQPALIAVAAGFGIAALVALLTPVRTARA